MWLAVDGLDSTDAEHFHHHRKFWQTVLLYTNKCTLLPMVFFSTQVRSSQIFYTQLHLINVFVRPPVARDEN